MKLTKNKYGFFEVEDKPSAEELNSYYREKYYQNAEGSYEHSYSENELRYFHNKIEEKLLVASRFIQLDSESKVVDIGCGEGWVLDYLRTRNIDVVGLDFSSYGCAKFNPKCLESFVEGDIYVSIDRLKATGKRFDLVWLDNVLEHVIDPLDLMRKCNSIMSEKGLLMVEVPNDFSVIQNYLLETGSIDKAYWVAFPDHLSYFNKEGLENLGAEAGLQAVFSMGDFPIDFNLINPNTNYYLDKSKGKSCYRAKVEFENLIHSVSVDKAINFYKSLIDLGIGRCLTTFFTKK